MFQFKSADPLSLSFLCLPQKISVPVSEENFFFKFGLWNSETSKYISAQLLHNLSAKITMWQLPPERLDAIFVHYDKIYCTEKRVFASSKERKTAKTNRGIPQPLSSMPLQITGFEVRLIIADAPIAQLYPVHTISNDSYKAKSVRLLHLSQFMLRETRLEKKLLQY